MPRNLSTSLRSDTALSLLQAELLSEQAAALGRSGREVETALRTLAQAGANAQDRDALIRSAADTVWRFFVQREALGLHDHAAVVAHYAIPPTVLARVGAR